jgi:hypothetical protein
MTNLEMELMKVLEARISEIIPDYPTREDKEELRKVYILSFFDALGMKEICQRICKE